MAATSPRARVLTRRGVSPVIAVILLVAITVVLAAVLYVTSTSLVNSQGIPVLTGLVKTSQNGTAVKIQVADVSQAGVLVVRFQAVITIDGVIDEASRIKPLNATSRGNLTFQSADDLMTSGDILIVALSPGHEYTASLLLLDTGRESGSIRFST